MVVELESINSLNAFFYLTGQQCLVARFKRQIPRPETVLGTSVWINRSFGGLVCGLLVPCQISGGILRSEKLFFSSHACKQRNEPNWWTEDTNHRVSAYLSLGAEANRHGDTAQNGAGVKQKNIGRSGITFRCRFLTRGCEESQQLLASQLVSPQSFKERGERHFFEKYEGYLQ